LTAPITVLPVAASSHRYEIHIGRGLLERGGAILAPLLRRPRAVLVTDRTLAAGRHPARLGGALAAAGIRTETLVVPPGEGTKSMAELARLLDELLALGIDRNVTILAMGGGVVGDLAGFAAAVALRGLDLVQVPTTLLAQIDSSVGGKTGVNSAHGKNLIGAFHPPRCVLADLETLDDLPERELRAGYAELVKHAFIRDAELFAWLERHGAAVLAGNAARRAEAIHRSVAIKIAIVAADEHETTGERALLNFGHTFAHAYETIAGYGGTLLHGEAVSLGMVRAFELSVRLGHCAPADLARARRHLVAMGLPVSARTLRNDPFPPEAMLAVMARDKKVQDGRLTFVLSRGIGAAFVDSTVPIGALRDVLAGDG
jgi:3-dehydroquinate synthase